MKVFSILNFPPAKEWGLHDRETYVAFFANAKAALESALGLISEQTLRHLHVREEKLFSENTSWKPEESCQWRNPEQWNSMKKSTRLLFTIS